VDLSQVFGTAPRTLALDRLNPTDLRLIRDTLAAQGMKLHDGEKADRQLLKLRSMYEPFVYSLAMHLSQTLPPWIPQKKGKDNWQTSAWARESGLLDKVDKKDGTTVTVDEHF
jgi:hypothetical protein